MDIPTIKSHDDTIRITAINDVTPSHERPVITVWIHGSKLLFSKLVHLFSFCPKGLSHAINLEEKYHHRKIANTFFTHYPQQFLQEHFYLFGWSGKLSFNTRKRTATQLFEELISLIEKYKNNYGIVPFVRIITHSHGGNVALNLALCFSKEHDFVIDELILLACPVQEETQELVHAPCFKKIISLYSNLDSVQILDPQGLYKKTETTSKKKKPLFSKRIFPHAPHIIQAKIRMNGRGLFHLEFLMPKFLKTLPTIINTLYDSYNSKGPQEKPYKVSVRLK